MNYLDNINKDTLEYFKVLEPDFPTWLIPYINTPVMLKQQYISTVCGKNYTKLFNIDYYYSSLDHSIAVALIVWHFTHDKKQTLAGLFHDIATPTFKHCVDFLNGDYMKQESTEDLTSYMISSSKEIMALLNKDNIKLEEVNDYHIYPIADNDTPKLSADRLEYSLSNALFNCHLAKLDTIREIYNDISIQTNEDGIAELGFNNLDVGLKFVWLTSVLSVIYRDDKTRYSMQLIADILKDMGTLGIVTKEDLYTKREDEMLEVMRLNGYKDVIDTWSNACEVLTSREEPKGVYYVCHGAKVRYINPLVNNLRITDKSRVAQEMIDKNLSYDMSKYVYLDMKLERKL